MERKECYLYLMLTWILMGCTGAALAQQAPHVAVYQAFINDRMEEWDRVIEDLAGREASLTDDQLIELVGFYYGYVGWAIGQGMDRKAKAYIRAADDLIERLLVKYPEKPELHAYKGAFLGFKIGLNKLKAVVLGPESMKHINRAVETGPERPQGWIEKGNALYYMPKMFGGSKEKALEAYRRAIGLMEEDPGLISDNWMYLNVLMILGQSYEEIGELQMAKNTYEKILQVEPGFTYVRDELYPALRIK
jgi:tetratricopeptide (TPR) repeat protein